MITIYIPQTSFAGDIEKIFIYVGHLESNEYSPIYFYTVIRENDESKRQDIWLLRVTNFNACIDAIA